MSDEKFDIFLNLTPYRFKGLTVSGETFDADFGTDEENAIEIDSFDVTFGKGSTGKGGGKNDLKLTKGEDGEADDLKALLARINDLERKVAEFEKKLEQPDDANSEGRLLKVKKVVDSSSTQLFRAYMYGVTTREQTLSEAAAGKEVKVRKPEFVSGVVTVRKAGGGQHGFLELSFGNLRVVSYDLSVNDPTPDEEIEFKFGQMMMRYRPQKASGELLASRATDWDFVEQKRWQKKPAFKDNLTVGK